jgi:fatty acid desaturase
LFIGRRKRRYHRQLGVVRFIIVTISSGVAAMSCAMGIVIVVIVLIVLIVGIGLALLAVAALAALTIAIIVPVVVAAATAARISRHDEKKLPEKGQKEDVSG